MKNEDFKSGNKFDIDVWDDSGMEVDYIEEQRKHKPADMAKGILKNIF